MNTERNPEAEALELSKQFSRDGNKQHAINMVFALKGIFVTGNNEWATCNVMMYSNRDVLFTGTYKECLAFALDYNPSEAQNVLP